MNQLVTITTNEQGSLVVSTLDFATGLGIQHKNLLETIRTHQEVIERDFGLIAFQTRKIELGKGRPESVAFLTEDQALFVGTLSRNSKQVVEFKSVLVQSFAEARKRLLPTTTEQVLIQLVSKQTQLLAESQQMLSQLRSDVDRLIAGYKPIKPIRLDQQRTLPCMPSIRRVKSNDELRPLIHKRIIDYCSYHDASTQDTYNYLYKRLFDVYNINVHRLIRTGGDSLLDAIERYGHLDRLYSLVMAELTYYEE